ncbi:hypothetical protein EDD36DRAFT_467398 [Exophiala viscosa]|uniref:GH16 domain-containing protein n=1 Tax=Exophiala viscosa TaxID=2486360 RepID=A0AAN6IC74_9EURO|nr:hypothetical protein EDD36DRAFT_467398 [Exophiala viscosa]
MANFYLLHVFLAIGVLCAIAEADCNPLVNASCPAIPGLATNTYSVDFTQQTATPSDWIQAEGETVTYDSQNGATFTFANRYDAPYIWSRFYLLFGHVEVVVKIAKGEGIITAATLLSDDLDEVDWEWSGNNFDQSSGLVQTNYFGKGVTGDYDRSTTVSVSDPQDEFHTYTWDWTPSALTWSIDGTSIRTLTNNYQTTGDYQYPQTPSRIHLGVWDAGDPGNNPATIYWGGGTTNISLAPFSGYVKSVKVTTSTPCSSYQYPNSFNGTYEDVLCTNQTIIVPCTYSVAAGDNGQTIADSLGVTLDALKAANPNIDWDLLIVGQTLKVPGGDCPTSTTSTTRSTTSTTLSTTSTTLSTTSLSFNFANTSTTTSRTSNTTPSMISSNTSTVIITTTVTSSISLTSTSSAAPSSGPSQTAVATTASSASPTAALSTFNSVSLTSAAPTVTTAGTPAATSTQSATYSLYTVVAGDYGYEIASKLGCSFDALSAVNSGVDWDMLMPGQTLNIPCTVSGASSIGATVVSQPSATSAAGTGSISASGQSVVSSSGPGQQSPAAAATTGGVSVDSASAAATTLPDSSPAAATQSNTSIPGSIQSSAAPTALSNIADSSSTSCTTLPADSQAAATSTPYWSNSTVASSFVASNATSLSVMSSTAPTSPTASDFAAATTTVLPDDDDTSAAPTSQSTTTISGTTVTSTSSLLMSSQTTSDMSWHLAHNAQPGKTPAADLFEPAISTTSSLQQHPIPIVLGINSQDDEGNEFFRKEAQQDAYSLPEMRSPKLAHPETHLRQLRSPKVRVEREGQETQDHRYWSHEVFVPGFKIIASWAQSEAKEKDMETALAPLLIGAATMPTDDGSHLGKKKHG